MKLKSLLLGSLAAAGLSTAGYAADLNVLTSLDTCDALGMSGLTISSDTNCLVFSGSVEYRYRFGDYNSPITLVSPSGGGYTVMDNDGTNDSDSRLRTELKIGAYADSEFGTAAAILKLRGRPNEAMGNVIYIEEGYVSIGDQTVIMAGKKDSVFEDGTDAPYNYLGLFNSEGVDTGVNSSNSLTGNSYAIQVTSDLGNGVYVSGGLERLGTSATTAAVPATGTGSGILVGVVGYKGDMLTAHLSVATGGILDGTIEATEFHAGAELTVDQFKFLVAAAGDSSGYWNALASAQADLDIFTLAVSAEATSASEWGAGASIAADVTDGVTASLGARFFQDSATANDNVWEAAGKLAFDVTETVTLAGTLGVIATGSAADTPSVTYGYGKAELNWKPGGGFTTDLAATYYTTGGYRIDFTGKKTFE